MNSRFTFLKIETGCQVPALSPEPGFLIPALC